MSLFEELKRRNVFRVTIAYAVMAWLLVQVGDIVLEATGAPGWVMRTLIAGLALGLLPIALFAWAYELTPEGIKRESEIDRSQSITSQTGRRLNVATILMLASVAGLFLWDRFLRDPGSALPETFAAAPRLAPAGPATAAVAPPILDGAIAIAVLPFVNLSSDPEQEYFSDGISEELLNVLAKLPDLRVAARTSSFQFKGENRDIAEIARVLRVNHILEGSVRKAGQRLRVTAQLINASTGYHVWSETYDRELDDVFAIQDEISSAIGRALQGELGLDSPGLASVPRVVEAANTAAYEAFLRGRALINERGNRAITQAVHELEKAIRLDPNYAPAHAQLAIAIAMLLDSPSTYGSLTLAEVNARATPHIDTALAINRELPEVWGAQTLLALQNSRFDEGLRHADRALALNPAYVDVINWTNNVQTAIGDYAGAEASLERLLELDPLSVVGRVNYVFGVATFEDPELARRMSEELLDESLWAGYTAHSLAPYLAGDYAASMRWSLLAFGVDPLDRFSNTTLVIGFATLGLDREAARISDPTRAVAALFGGHFADAERLVREDLTRDPENRSLHGLLGAALYHQRKYEAAVAAFEAALDPVRRLVPSNGGFYTDESARYAFSLRRLGRREEAAGVIERMRADYDARTRSALAGDPLLPRDLALIRMLEDAPEEALERLAEAVATRVIYARRLQEPLLEPLEGDPRFVALTEDYDAELADERRATLALICEANPIPESWQPLPETCAR